MKKLVLLGIIFFTLLSSIVVEQVMAASYYTGYTVSYGAPNAANNDFIKAVVKMVSEKVTPGMSATTAAAIISLEAKRLFPHEDTSLYYARWEGNSFVVGCTNRASVTFNFNLVSYSWSMGDWGSCINGTKTRTVVCKGSNGSIATAAEEASHCNGSKPQTTQTCSASTTTSSSSTTTSSSTSSSGNPPSPVPVDTKSCNPYTNYYLVWDDCVFLDGSILGNTLKCNQKTKRQASGGGYCGTYIVYSDGSTGSCSSSSSCDTYNNPNGLPSVGTLVPRDLNFSSSTTTTGQTYANNSDKINVSITIQGNINGKSITGIPSSFEWIGSNVMSNITTGTGAAALTLRNNLPVLASSSVYQGGTLATLNLTSVTPVDTIEGRIDFKLGGAPAYVNGVKLNFLKPFFGKIQVRDVDIKEDNNPKAWDGEIKLGTLSRYKLVVSRKTNVSPTGIKISDQQKNEFENTIKKYSPEQSELNIITLDEETKKLIDVEKLSFNYDIPSDIEFQARINTTEKATKMPTSPGLQIDKATISYNLDGKDVKYYIGPDGVQDIAATQQQGGPLKVNNPYPITKDGSKFLGVKVIGGIQGGGNSEFTGQNQNISSISSMETRTQIRKNAYTYISSMKSGDVINGVKYVFGDITLPEQKMDYETLVVKDGNVIINGNLNQNNTKLLGIIVLKDGYNVSNGYEGKGNVYVTPSVQNINAIIYADGGFISIKDYVNNEATLYKSDSTDRTQGLNRQLYMNGSLFTRNTIGGAVLANQTGDKYTLPGGARTTEFNIALQYDLNYIRRGKSLCENAGGPKQKQPLEECIYKEPFIIKYDPRVQTTPPKLFGN